MEANAAMSPHWQCAFGKKALEQNQSRLLPNRTAGFVPFGDQAVYTQFDPYHCLLA
jgi:hypothetical protein